MSDAGPACKPQKLNVALLEPYFGGSHAAFVDTLVGHSRHDICVATMPPRKWKWRMRGAAIWFAMQENKWLAGCDGRAIDLILCNDMLSVADLRGLLPPARRNLPIACYFHENQLTYPLPCEKDRDYQYGMTNISSCLAADAIWFNSAFHLGEFLDAAARLLKKMPDCVPGGLINSIREKCIVVPPPIELPAGLGAPPRESDTKPWKGDRVRILWSHRWEYDKNPEPFFHALIRLAEAGCDFELVLLGEQFRTAPPVFSAAWPCLQPHIVHAGFLPDRDAYWEMIATCDVVVSSAIQENLGLSVVEAILAGCQPLLPHRLAYPELIPVEFHSSCLYARDHDLFDRMHALVRGNDRLSGDHFANLWQSLRQRFAASEVVPQIDELFVELAMRVPPA
ncbi:MAG: DUF3524 domain-containing protein [Planctomycetes bacterium]|nr:DUF3524 domain-containing protein [Planctomycetota bacterium]